MSRVPPDPSQRPHGPDPEVPVVGLRVTSMPEGDKTAVDLRGQCPGQLERVSLAASEKPLEAERRRGDVNDAHLSVSLVTLGDPDRVTGGYLYHRRMAALAPAHGATVRFLSFPERRFPMPALTGRSIMRDAGAADAVVLDSIAAAFAALWLDALGATPMLGSLHQPPGGIDHGLARRRFQAGLDRRTYRRCRLLIVASKALAEDLEREGLPRDRMRVVPPGRDPATALAESEPPSAVSSAGPSSDELRRGRRMALLSVGAWIQRKGALELLEAVARLPEDAVTLHLVGDDRTGAYADRVRSRITQSDLLSRVVVHGALPPERVPVLYRGADAFALASTREPYGTVYGEAMAEGLPVVGWRAGNLPHLAEDGREGLMAEPGDVTGLSRALERLAEDEGLRRRLGEAARLRAASRPTWEESAAGFFAAIREATAYPGGRA